MLKSVLNWDKKDIGAFTLFSKIVCLCILK